MALCAGLATAGCVSPGANVTLGPDGRPLAQVYRIDPAETDRIAFRLLDSVNALRSARGAGPLAYSAELNAAAATHSRDMAVQNRPWHFGSDGSSPLQRVARAGYRGRLVGEVISETFETELETLGAWMGDPSTRDVILDATADQIGFAWFQEPSGKIWWTLLTGASGGGGGAGAFSLAGQ